MGTSSAFSGPAPNVFLKIYWAAFPSQQILLGRTSRFPGHLLGRPSVPSRRPRPCLGLCRRRCSATNRPTRFTVWVLPSMALQRTSRTRSAPSVHPAARPAALLAILRVASLPMMSRRTRMTMAIRRRPLLAPRRVGRKIRSFLGTLREPQNLRTARNRSRRSPGRLQVAVQASGVPPAMTSKTLLSLTT